MTYKTLIPHKKFAVPGDANLRKLILKTTILTQIKPVNLEPKCQFTKRFKEFCPLDGQEKRRGL